MNRKSIPTTTTCLHLLQKSGCSKEVIAHCQTVRTLAVKIAKKAGANVQLVEAGALLHDIGRARTHGIDHGVEGAKIAKELGLPKSLICIIERHIGAGIPKSEAAELGLPPKDYMPITLEEKIVAHADNLLDDGARHTIESEIEKALNQGKVNLARRLRTLHDELSAICKVDLNEL